jgi:alpha/beta superfamily hydrolase
MIDRTTLSTSDGVALEARWDVVPDAKAVVVFCHPHPEAGGTMIAPLMVAVTTWLNDHRLSVLRFNFRGTQGSGGEHEGGPGEMLDIDAAVDEAAAAGLPVGIAGWSFGAAMAIRWLSERHQEFPSAGIAPPPDLLPDELPRGPMRIILGRREQDIASDQLLDYATRHAIDLVLTAGDHFFHGRGKKIGDLVAQALVTPPS